MGSGPAIQGKLADTEFTSHCTHLLCTTWTRFSCILNNHEPLKSQVGCVIFAMWQDTPEGYANSCQGWKNLSDHRTYTLTHLTLFHLCLLLTSEKEYGSYHPHTWPWKGVCVGGEGAN